MKTILKKAAAKTALVAILFLSGITVLPAQSAGYNTGIGLRFGPDFGLTIRTGAGSGYFEGIIGSGYRALTITALYERFTPVFNTAGFNIYYGLGGHIGLYDRWGRYGYYDRWGYYHPQYEYVYTGPSFGIDGIFGLEYKFQTIPFALGLDIKPFFDFYRYGYGAIDPGLSFRYTF